MRKRFFGRSAGALLIVGLVAGCGGGDDAEQTEAPPPAATPPASQPAGGAGAASGDLAAGTEVFNGTCMACHGAGGAGTPLAPSLNDDTWLWIDPAQPLQPQIESIVRQGVPQPKEHPAPMLPMGGASLTDQQITAVAAYVASL